MNIVSEEDSFVTLHYEEIYRQIRDMKLCERLCRSQTIRRETYGLAAIFKSLQIIKTFIANTFTCNSQSKRNYKHYQITQRSICRHLVTTSQCSIKVFESLSSCL